MRLQIEHETLYRFSEAVPYSIQGLRLTPRDHIGQRVLVWRMDGSMMPGMKPVEDPFGNLTHTVTIDHPHTGIHVRVMGMVETEDTAGIIRGTQERFPLLFYRRTTPQTMPNAALRELAYSARTDRGEIARLHDLMQRIRDRIDYQTGVTHAQTTAAEALARGAGVCQDHAHVFLCCARILGIPARYVSGYLCTDEEADAVASHAWAEAYVADLGWIGFDVANRVCPTAAYVRMAVGLDYRQAAPFRGIRRGRAGEMLSVRVRVARA